MPETIKIDHESQVPVYKQIVGQVEALVRSGEYAEGCLLPSMNELSAMLDISKETVKGLLHTSKQGIHRRQTGQGILCFGRRGLGKNERPRAVRQAEQL